MKKLDEIIARQEAATKGPWRGDRYDGTIKYFMLGADSKLETNDDGETTGYILQVDHKNGTSGFARDADEQLVLNAPSDIQWLRERLEECLPCLEALRESNLERYGMFAASLQSLIVEITPTEVGK